MTLNAEDDRFQRWSVIAKEVKAHLQRSHTRQHHHEIKRIVPYRSRKMMDRKRMGDGRGSFEDGHGLLGECVREDTKGASRDGEGSKQIRDGRIDS